MWSIASGYAYSNLQKYRNRNPLVRFAINRFFKTLRVLLTQTGVINILDAGCGEGFYIYHLVRNCPCNLKFTGIDHNYDAILTAKILIPDQQFIQADIYQIPQKDKAFDMVLCLEVLEHLEDLGKALQEIFRVSAKYCLFSVPHEPFFSMCRLLGGKDIARFGRHPEHINRLKSKDIIKMLGGRFKNIKKFTSFPWIFILGEIK